jgi:hypothetical protein
MVFSGVLSRHNRFGFMRSNCSRSRSIPFPITRGAQVKNINVPPMSGGRRPDEHRPRGHVRPDNVGRERPPVGAGPGPPPGGGSGGRSRPAPPHLQPRGCGGGEERRLDHQHGASRSRGSSMTCHATLPLDLFATCACTSDSRSVDRGTTAPASVVPPFSTRLSGNVDAISVLENGHPSGERRSSRDVEIAHARSGIEPQV